MYGVASQRDINSMLLGYCVRRVRNLQPTGSYRAWNSKDHVVGPVS